MPAGQASTPLIGEFVNLLESAYRKRPTGIGLRESAYGNRPTGIGLRESADCNSNNAIILATTKIYKFINVDISLSTCDLTGDLQKYNELVNDSLGGYEPLYNQTLIKRKHFKECDDRNKI